MSAAPVFRIFSRCPKTSSKSCWRNSPKRNWKDELKPSECFTVARKGKNGKLKKKHNFQCLNCGAVSKIRYSIESYFDYFSSWCKMCQNHVHLENIEGLPDEYRETFEVRAKLLGVRRRLWE